MSSERELSESDEVSESDWHSAERDLVTLILSYHKDDLPGRVREMALRMEQKRQEVQQALKWLVRGESDLDIGSAVARVRDEMEARRAATARVPLRIRVGVTADGHWSSCGASEQVAKSYTYGAEVNIEDEVSNCASGPVVAWYWLTGEVPLPVVERGDVLGEVRTDESDGSGHGSK